MFLCVLFLRTLGTECEGLSALQTLKQTASDPTRSTTFNYASEALNNSFFLSTLVSSSLSFRPIVLYRILIILSILSQTPTPIPLDPSSSLAQSITNSFSSYSAFQSKFSSHVAGLHPSSGAYVWLVTDISGNLGLVGTYAGGTVLVYQRIQMGNVPSMGAILGEKIAIKTSLAVDEKDVDGKKKKIVGGASKFATIPAGSRSDSTLDLFNRGSGYATGQANADSRKPIHPLMCLSLHPHCYLGDYGVWGRQEYVERWWNAIDWTKVSASYEMITSKGKAT